MWFPVLLLTLVAAGLVMVPGALLARLLGLPWSTVWFFAPLVGVAMIGVSAYACDLLGFAWTPLALIACLAVILAVASLVMWLIRRVGWKPARAPEGGLTSVWWFVAAAALSAVLLTLDLLAMIGEPENFSQSWDAIHHLNLTQWMVSEHQATTLSDSMDGVSGFYPVAWHNIASQVMMFTGTTSVPTATNATALATVAIFWPVSMLALLRTLFRLRPVPLMGAAVLLTGFTAFPHLYAWYGVLYPNLLAGAIAPAVMSLGVSLLGLGRGTRYPTLSAWLLLIVGIGGVSLAHPNVTVMLVSVVGSVMVVFWAAGPLVAALRARSVTRKTLIQLPVLAVWLIGAYLLFHELRPSPTGWDARRTFVEALIEGVLVSPLENSAYWPGVAFLLLGILAVIWTGRFWWLLTTHVVLLGFWVVGAAETMGYWRIYLLAPWYGDPYRLAAFLPLTAIPLAALGLSWVLRPLEPWLSSTRASGRSWVGPVLGISFVSLLAVATQVGSARQRAVEEGGTMYSVTDGSRVVSADELSLIEELPSIVPEGDVIAVNPYDGGSMAYALAGINVTQYHVGRDNDPTVQVLVNGLDQLGTDPEVCEVIDDLGVRWVLDFNDGIYISNENRPYPGWADIARTPGFELRAREGDASLYEVTGCD